MIKIDEDNESFELSYTASLETGGSLSESH